MKTKNRKFTVAFDGDGYPEIFDGDSKRLSPPDVEVFLAELRHGLGDSPCMYIMYDEDAELYKIGVSANLDRRRKELKATIAGSIRCHNEYAYTLESRVHQRLNPIRVKREWFDFSGNDVVLASLLRLRSEEQLINWLSEPIVLQRPNGNHA